MPKVSKEKRTTKMSPTERSRRRAAVGKAASKKIAKSEQLNFRIEEQAINDLQELAYLRGLPVSTMIHDWVIERLAQEKFGKPEVTGKVLQLFSEFHIKLQQLFGSSVYQSESTTTNMKVAEHPLQYEPKLNKRKSTASSK